MTFIPEWLVTYYEGLPDRIWDEGNQVVNDLIKEKYPQLAASSVRRWTKAYASGNYRTDTSPGHYYTTPAKPIIPLELSQFNSTFIPLMKDLHKKSKRTKERIRVVNSQDLHANQTDPALLRIRNKVIKDFDPHIFPVLMDDVDNSLLEAHRPLPQTSGHTIYRESEYTPQQQAVESLMDLTEDILKKNRETAPDAIMIHGGSNHFDWIFRQLIENAGPFTSHFIRSYMKILHDYNVLWVEGDRRQYFPLTKRYFFMHGKLTRQSYPGATAVAYMRKYEGKVAVSAGHTHRQEVIWSSPDPITGERLFYDVCGTLGTLQPYYNRMDYLRHTWGLNLIELFPHTFHGAEVHMVKIYLENQNYVCYFRGKKYKEPKTIDWEWESPYDN